MDLDGDWYADPNRGNNNLQVKLKIHKGVTSFIAIVVVVVIKLIEGMSAFVLTAGLVKMCGQ